MEKLTDYSAGATVAAAPFWANYITAINAWLTMLSLVVGLAFIVWRWRRAMKRQGDID